MFKSRKLLLSAIVAAVVASVAMPMFSSLRAADAPAKAAAAPAVSARDESDVLRDLQTTSAELRRAIRSPKDLIDTTQQAQVAPKVIPPLKKMVALFKEMGEVSPESATQSANQAAQMQAFLSYLGDADTAKDLKTMAASKDAVTSTRGKLAQSLVSWWKASKDEKAQEGILDSMKKIAADTPKDDNIAMTLMTMKNLGAASDGVGDKAEAIIADTLTGRYAMAIRTQRAGTAKQREALNKPIELAAKTVDGKDFSTKEYKGKVILIDFWATWCPPCREELPHVKEVYKKYHDKGLEIVGVSCDDSGDTLSKFTEKEGMPWVQLWDKSQADGEKWHALAKQWGVDGIPTMFLIDRDGKLRTMEARQNMEEMIPKLLEEKAGETPSGDVKKDAGAAPKKDEVKKDVNTKEDAPK